MYRSGSGLWQLAPGMVRVSHAGAAGPFDPLSLSPAVWWALRDPTTLYTDAGSTLVSADGDAIYRVGDKSGNGIYVEQSTSSQRPLYKTNIQGGQSAALGNRSAAKRWTRSSISVQVAEWWFVASLNASLIFYDALVADNPSGAAGANMVRALNTNNIGVANSDDFASGGGSTWVNGVSTSAVTYDTFFISRHKSASSYTYDVLAVMADAQENRHWADYLGEALGFTTGLSTANANLLGGYLADVWGMTWTNI